jgi:hypothetical protein
VKFRDWIWVYLATGPGFTRRAVLAYYGGGVVILTCVAVIALAAGPKAIFLWLLKAAAALADGALQQ